MRIEVITRLPKTPELRFPRLYKDTIGGVFLVDLWRGVSKSYRYGITQLKPEDSAGTTWTGPGAADKLADLLPFVGSITLIEDE